MVAPQAVPSFDLQTFPPLPFSLTNKASNHDGISDSSNDETLSLTTFIDAPWDVVPGNTPVDPVCARSGSKYNEATKSYGGLYNVSFKHLKKNKHNSN